jgi:hypothetical protein
MALIDGLSSTTGLMSPTARAGVCSTTKISFLRYNQEVGNYISNEVPFMLAERIFCE